MIKRCVRIRKTFIIMRVQKNRTTSITEFESRIQNAFEDTVYCKCCIIVVEGKITVF